MLLVPICVFGTIFDFESRFYKSESPIYYNRLRLEDPYIFNMSLVNSANGWDISAFSFRSDTLFVDSNKLFFYLGNIGFTPNCRLIGNVDNVVGFMLNDVLNKRNLSFGAYYKNSLLHPTSLFMGGWYDAYHSKIYYKLSTEGRFSTEIGMYKEFENRDFNFDYLAFVNPTLDSTPYVSPGTGVKFNYSNDYFTIGGVSKVYAWRYRFLYHYYPDGLSFISLYFNIHSHSDYYLGGGINMNRDFKNYMTLSDYVTQNIKLNKRSYLNSSFMYYMNKRNIDNYKYEEYDLSNHIIYNLNFLNLSIDAGSSFLDTYFKNIGGISFFINYQQIFGRYYIGYMSDPSPLFGQSGIFNRFYLSWNYQNYGLSAEFNTIKRSLSKVYVGGRVGHGITSLEAGYTWSNSVNTLNLSFRTGGSIEKLNANYLKGKVYYDKNSNKVFDKGDSGTEGVNIYIDGKLRGKSDDNGNFKIYFIPSGKHKISLGLGSMPAFIGAENTSMDIMMPKLGSVSINIPFFKLSSISGKVFFDENENGFYDKGEKGVPNILVETGEKWTITDEEGDYTLANLLPGQYLVVPKLLPKGYHISLYNLKMIIYLKQGDIAKNIDFGITKKSKNIIMKEF